MSAPPTKIVRLPNRNTPERALLRDLRRVARFSVRRLVSGALYSRYGAFGKSTMIARFGSWNAAVEAAGLGTVRRWRVPTAELMQNLADVWQKLGRQPAFSELTRDEGVSRFAGFTYTHRFGSWRRALVAFRPAARARGLGAVTLPIRPKAKSPRRGPSFRLRAKVLIRDNCLCRMCGAGPATDVGIRLHVDHIVPWSKGGETVLANLQTLCSACNLGKGDILDAAVSKRPPPRYVARIKEKRKKRCPRPTRPIASNSN